MGIRNREVSPRCGHDSARSRDDTPMIEHDLDRFLHPAAPGYNVLGDQKPLARRDCKAAPKHEAARAILLRENMPFPEVAGDFLSDNDSPDSWRDYRRGLIFSELLRQQATYARGDRRPPATGAHIGKIGRLCSPERSTKCPLSKAPVLWKRSMISFMKKEC